MDCGDGTVVGGRRTCTKATMATGRRDGVGKPKPNEGMHARARFSPARARRRRPEDMGASERAIPLRSLPSTYSSGNHRPPIGRPRSLFFLLMILVRHRAVSPSVGKTTTPLAQPTLVFLTSWSLMSWM